MKIKIKYFLTFVFFFSVIFLNNLGGFSFAQNRNIDSLLTLIKTNKPDTNQVNNLNILSREYTKSREFELGLKYGNKALALASSLTIANTRGWAKGIASAYNNIGNIYYSQGNYPETALKNHIAALKIWEAIKDKQGIAASYNSIGLIYWTQGNYAGALKSHSASLKIREEIKDKKGVAASYNNIGLIYMGQGNHPEALKNHFASLKIREELKDKQGVATSYRNIGNIYLNMGNYVEALTNQFASLKISEEIGDKPRIAACYNSIGVIYWQQGNYSEALKKLLISLKIKEQLKDKFSIAISYENIGNVYYEQGNYDEALKNYFASLKLEEDIGNKNGIANSFIKLGEVQTKLKKYKEAQIYLNKALHLSIEIGSKEDIKESYSGLEKLDSAQNNWKAAYKHHKQFIVYRDSIDNEETKKKIIETILTYKFEAQEAATKATQDKKDAVAAKEKQKQKVITYSVSVGLFLVLLLALFIFRGYRLKQKTNIIIIQQKAEVEKQKELVEEKNKIVEEKNKDITDSIYYAKRIQNALLRDEEHTSTHLPEHFILFMPKDIVSGDFYWGAEKDNHWYFAAVDCTGHGVPGAVMSMLGISFLNDIVAQEFLSPAEILNRLRNKVVKELRQTGEADSNKDGMDISLVRLNLKTYELQWAGANNGLNLIQTGQFKEVKADKQPIGYYPETHPFTNHEIQLKKGDSIYIYSDGYADQFGGTRGKKFKYKQLQDLIISNNHLQMKDQKELFKKHFIEWKGSLEQIDDVCVFGVRV